jgi:two-component system chemotaxis response regulator CheB
LRPTGWHAITRLQHAGRHGTVVNRSDGAGTMQPRDVIVIGASAGGVEALAELASGLPEGLPAAIFVVLHLPQDAHSHLPDILDRAGPLPAEHAVDGSTIHPGRIYVAPPNRHLLLDGAHLRLSIGPRVNNVRPSIDVLFRSAARAFEGRVIGVVLSGNLDDGTLGLDAIQLRGGTVVIQDPDEAQFSGMPRSALERVKADFVLPIAEIPPLLVDLSAEAIVGRTRQERSNAVTRSRSPNAASDDAAPPPRGKRGNAASGFTCPNCHGSVWELDDGGLPHIECRVGHAFSVDAFLGEQAIALEDAIWSAINALEERATTLRRFSEKFEGSRRRQLAYLEQAETVERQAALLRDGLARVIQTEGNGEVDASITPSTAPRVRSYGEVRQTDESEGG